MSRKRLLFISGLIILILLLLQISPDIPSDELNEIYTNTESKFLSVNGMEVHYRDEGTGMPVVLIHGTAASLHTWDDWTRELKKDYRIIRMDIPAFGLTGPDPKADYSIEGYTNFLKDFLDELEIDSMYLVGNSLGGNISWSFAGTYPDRVKKLVLIDASGLISNKDLPWIFTLARTPVLNSIIKYFTPRSITEDNLKQVYWDDSKVTEDIIDRYHQMVLREGNRQAFIDRAKTEYGDLSPLLSNIKSPTLIIWGEDDTWIPVSDASRFDSQIANSRIHIMKQTGHVPMEERPKKSVEETINFFDEI